PVPVPVPEPVQGLEQQHECLEQCMKRLTPNNRDLVLEYYQEVKQAKIDRSRKLANRLGIAVNALSIRAHRIRATLQACAFQCIKQVAAGWVVRFRFLEGRWETFSLPPSLRPLSPRARGKQTSYLTPSPERGEGARKAGEGAGWQEKRQIAEEDRVSDRRR